MGTFLEYARKTSAHLFTRLLYTCTISSAVDDVLLRLFRGFCQENAMNTVEVCANVGFEQEMGPIQGGVQQLGELLDSDEHFSPEKNAGAVQQSSPLLDELDGNQNLQSSAGALIPAERRTAGEDAAPATSMGLPAISPFTKAGRKAVITPQVAEQICMLLSVGFSRRQAANYLGFSPMTITMPPPAIRSLLPICDAPRKSATFIRS
jgi:hypothetical protein